MDKKEAVSRVRYLLPLVVFAILGFTKAQEKYPILDIVEPNKYPKLDKYEFLGFKNHIPYGSNDLETWHRIGASR